MHIFISGVQSFWFFKSSKMFFSFQSIQCLYTGKLCIVYTAHSLHGVAFLQCIACTSPSWCVSQASVPPLHCPHWTLLSFSWICEMFQSLTELHSEVDLCPCNFSSTLCPDFVVWGLFHVYICIYNCQVHEKPHNKNFHHFLTYDRWSIASAVDQPDKYKFNLRYSQIHLMT